MHEINIKDSFWVTALKAVLFFLTVAYSCFQVAQATELEPVENVHNGRSQLWWHVETGCVFDKPEPYGNCIEEVLNGDDFEFRTNLDCENENCNGI